MTASELAPSEAAGEDPRLGRNRSVSRRWAEHVWPNLLVVAEVEHDRCLVDALGLRHINVRTAADAATALISIGHTPPDAALVPLSMDGVDCAAWVAAVRAVSEMPILLSVDSNDDERLGPALMAGANAVVARPYDAEAIGNHLVEMWRLDPQHPVQPRLRVGPLEIDPPAFAVRFHGNEVRLSLREFELLACLMANAHRVVSPDEISEWLWGTGPDVPSMDAIKTHIQRLRVHFDDPEVIRTVRGQGYTVSHLQSGGERAAAKATAYIAGGS